MVTTTRCRSGSASSTELRVMPRCASPTTSAGSSALSSARTSEKLDSPSEPIGSDGESSFSDVLADDNAEDPAEVVGDAQRGMTLSSVLEALPERQRVVVTMRYGLDGRDPRTLDEIAK